MFQGCNRLDPRMMDLEQTQAIDFSGDFDDDETDDEDVAAHKTPVKFKFEIGLLVTPLID